MIKTNVGLCVIVFVLGAFLTNASPLTHGAGQQLVGANQCTWGPSYWCGNLTNAKNCNAVRHCIQTVWEKQSVPVDTDSICQICKDMVTQARDQLRSNQTMEELKEVFEGSCDLIPIKLVKKECYKLADDFVPELVEALSSQMNPDQVCTVAGLCNNAKIDELLVYMKALDGTIEEKDLKNRRGKKIGCKSCERYVPQFLTKINESKPRDIQKTVLKLCDLLPSFKDCSDVVNTHFDRIDKYLRSVDSRSLCHLTYCYTNFDDQEDEEALSAETDLLDFISNDVTADDCDFCEQFLNRTNKVLFRNTTVDEFKMILRGFCQGSENECLEIVDQYYAVLYKDLQNLRSKDVCPVLGVCSKASSTNNENKVTKIENMQLNECDGCKKYANEVVDKFKQATPQDMQETLIHWCGGLSSLSVGCSNIVTTYFSEFYNHLNKHLNANGLCHLSGYCIASYHQHPEIDEPLVAKTDLADLLKTTNKDDLPCEFCQQMVHHLRDVVIANTTEEEFKMVLNGFCNQTKGFRQECLSLVDQYYDIIYKNLVNNLDANGICILIGVCPRISSKHSVILPVFPPAEIKVTIKKKLGANEPKFTQEDLKSMQLPIDHLMGAANPNLLVENGQLCTICEYVLHFIQEALATPSTDDEIKHTVEGICKIMPNSIRGQCHDFIDMYGDAIIALLIQDLNPRNICPKMQLCPNHSKSDDVEVFRVEPYSDVSDKPTCPLCLFAVQEAQAMIKDKKTKKNIQNVLDKLCVHLPEKLQAECIDFVETYSNELIDMLMTDFKPQEICEAIKLCTNTNSYLSDLGISLEDDDDSSSEELFNDISGSNEDLPVEIAFKQDQDAVAPNCWLCEEFVKNAEKRINKNMSKAEIEKALQHSCDKLRKSVQPKCHKYIDKYGDKIAALILKEMEPKMICRELGLCLWSEQEDLEIDEALKYDVIAMPNEELTKNGQSERLTSLSVGILKDPPTCVLCEFIMTKLEAELQNKTEQDEIKRAIETICNKLPKTVAQSCDKFVEQYANAIIALIGSVPPKEICQKMQLCFAGLDKIVTDEVIECGICHGASMSLLPFFRQRTDNYEIGQHDMVSVGCEQLPAKYYQICSEMITIYGQSILNLSQKSYMDETHVCAEIGKCFDNEKSGLAFARISE